MIFKLWVRNCSGCEDASFHTAHLTWFGRFYFRRIAGWHLPTHNDKDAA